jgi:hypothetical protein
MHIYVLPAGVLLMTLMRSFICGSSTGGNRLVFTWMWIT